MATLTRKPLSWFKPDPTQPRKLFPEEELRALGASLKVRQIDPVQAKPCGMLIDGERRWRAAPFGGLTELDTIITDTPLSPAELQVVRLTGFFHKQGLTAPEQTDALAELQKATGWSNKEAAEHLHVDPSTVTRLLAPLKTIPPVLEAYRQGKLGVSEAYEFFKLTNEDQAALLEKKLSGQIKGRDALAAHGRKVRNGAKPAEGVKRIRIEMTSGVTAVFSCDSGLTLDQAIEAAADAAREMRKGRDQGLTAKTISKCSAERAKGVGRA